MRKPLQPGTKTALWPPGPLCDTAQFSQVTRQKTDDEVPFLKRPGLQNESFAHTSGHISCEMRKFKGITRFVLFVKGNHHN